MNLSQFNVKEWPWNFVAAVLDDDKAAESVFLAQPADLEATILYLIHSLPSMQKGNAAAWRLPEYLLLYFRDKKNYEEIGQRFGVSREAIHMPVKKALHMLRRPHCLAALRLGMTGAQDARVRRITENRSRELEAVIKRAENDAFAIGYAHGYSNGMHGRVIPDHVPKHAGDCCSLLFVSDVELSDFVDDVRVLNAFRRAGLMTIGDVALHYDEHGGLGGNWSMGVKCINWMNKALSELYGVTLPASQNVIRALRDAREAQTKLPDTV